MTSRLRNKTVLITGATSGFGKATAELLTKEGYKLILIGRREELLKKLKTSLETEVFIYKLDVRNRAEVAKFFQAIPTEFLNIDILINNAGLAKDLEVAQDGNLDDWDIQIDTNIKGLTYITRRALEIMKRKNSGLIINIGSVAATVPYKGGNVYGATKAFVKQFSRNLRTDLFGTNIKITNIEPEMAETEFSNIRFNGDKDKAKKIYEGTRALKAEDIANSILWIINQPEHVNIDNIEIMPVDQTFAGMIINRN